MPYTTPESSWSYHSTQPSRRANVSPAPLMENKVMFTENPTRRVFWAGLLLILAAFTASAQEFRGSLAGKILDPNGAVVPGSKVDIKNTETGIVSSSTKIGRASCRERV